MHGRTQRDPQSLRESQTRETAHESHDAKTFYGTAPRLCPLVNASCASRQAGGEGRRVTVADVAGGGRRGPGRDPKEANGPAPDLSQSGAP